MLGPLTHECTHGRGCACNPAPGRVRKAAVRHRKRSERQTVARDIRKTLADA